MGRKAPFYVLFEGAFLVYCVYLFSLVRGDTMNNKKEVIKASAAVQYKTT